MMMFQCEKQSEDQSEKQSEKEEYYLKIKASSTFFILHSELETHHSVSLSRSVFSHFRFDFSSFSLSLSLSLCFLSM